MTTTTTTTALEIWTTHIRAIRADAQDKRAAIYDRWLATAMGLVDRDRQMACVNAEEVAAVEGEKALYRANLAGEG
jgi:hypothetical protein